MTQNPSPPTPQTETWLATVKVSYESGYITEAVLAELLQPVTVSPKAVACTEALLQCCKKALVVLSEQAIERGTAPDKVACTGLTHTLAVVLGTATGIMPQWVITNSAQGGSGAEAYWLLDTEPTPHPGMRVYRPFEAGAVLTTYPPEEETADDEDTLADLNDLAARKGITVARSAVYPNHPLVLKSRNPYVLVDRWGEVLTTVESLTVAEGLLKLFMDVEPVTHSLE